MVGEPRAATPSEDGPNGNVAHLKNVDGMKADAAVTDGPAAAAKANGNGHGHDASNGHGGLHAAGSVPLPPPGSGAPRRNASLSQQLEAHVRELGGDRPIYSVLVANNGLAAVKFMRSVRSWASQALGSPRAVSLLAMATPDDMAVNAEHIQLADQFVEVPGGTNNNNYANVELIVQLAVRAGADAVWPGWGHASENPDLPRSLAAHGIRFLGPPAGPMAALGDKIGSTLLAQAAGVPTLPWSGSRVDVPVEACAGGVIPEALYSQACIAGVEEAVEACRAVGYPVMLKASWGGGGKGIRKVHSDDEVRAVYKQVAGEVPGSPIFAMKLAPPSRHLEVQLLCDMHGNVVSLYSRDCSVQRRHQKIVEEGPVTAAPPHVLRDMERCARALARLVGYVGAATVEYLYCIEEQKYYFLELNPRLQVEHPVTEGISGANLPACQLLIGCGVPLTRIPYIRSIFNKDPRGSEPFDPETEPQRAPEGHVVAVRVTAEDAADGFKPTAGRIDELHFRPTPDVWGYFSVKSGGGIHQFSDSQFGHLFARGETREAALRAMSVALRDVCVRGEVRTTTDYVLDLIAAPEFAGNAIHTGWLDSRIAARVKPGRPAWHISVIAGAVVKSAAAMSAASTEYLGYLAKGQLPPPGLSLTAQEHVMVIEGTKYSVSLTARGPGLAAVGLNGSRVEVAWRKMGDGGFLLQVDGCSHVVHAEDEAAGTRLLINGLTVLLAAEVDPSRLTASSPGKLTRRLLPNGAAVACDQPYAEMEVMKMVMPLLSPAAGTLRWVAAEGGVVNAGDLLATLELEEGAAVAAPEPFTGAFPELGPPQVLTTRLDKLLAAALESARNILAGYTGEPEAVVESLTACLDAPGLALAQWQAEFGVARGRLPGALPAALEGAVAGHAAEVAAAEAAAEAAAAMGAGGLEAGGVVHCGEFPAGAVMEVMERGLQDAPPADRPALSAALEPLLALARAHAGGRGAYARGCVVALLEGFLSVEEAFAVGADPGVTTEQEVVDGLRKQHAGKLQTVLELVVSHQGLPTKAALVGGLLARLVLPDPAPYRGTLRRLAALSAAGTAELAARAAQLLEQSLLADLRAVVARALSGLDMFTDPAAAPPSPTAAAAIAGVLSPRGPPAAAAAVPGSPGLPPLPGTPGGGGVARRSTVAEGMYSGLPVTARGSLHMSGAEARSERLVGASAAVEDALASLLAEGLAGLGLRGSSGGGGGSLQGGGLRRRAALTYVKRLYAPFLLREPLVQAAGEGTLLLVWMYDDPAAANTPAATQRLGALVLLERLEALPAALTSLAAALEGLRTEAVHGLGTLHVALEGGRPAAAAGLPRIDSSASLNGGAASGGGTNGGGIRHGRSSSFSPIVDMAGAVASDAAAIDAMLPPAEQGVPHSRATAAAIAAAVAAATPALRSLTCAAVSFLAPSSSACPLRLGWRWAPAAAATAVQSEPAAVHGSYRPDSFLSAVEPITASLLELSSLSAAAAAPPAGSGAAATSSGLLYRPSRNRQWHLYTAVERRDARSAPLRRLFVRGLVRSLRHPALLAASYSGNGGAVAAAAVAELEETLVSCLDELHRSAAVPAAADAAATRPDWTHVFLSVLPPLPLPPGGRDDPRVAAALRSGAAALVAKHGGALRQAGVAVWETRLRGPHRESAWRVVVSMPTGHERGEEHVEVYREVLQHEYEQYVQQVYGGAPPTAKKPAVIAPPPLRVYCPAVRSASSGGAAVPLDSGAKSLAGVAVGSPYPPLEGLQQKRLAARRHNVTYVYDFPAVFEAALRGLWAERAAAGEPASVPPAARLVEATELVLPPQPGAGPGGATGPCADFRSPPRLRPAPLVRPAVGGNDCGMVAWALQLRTPECPQGRSVIAVANDITWQSGAFSPAEDAVFRAACEAALEERLPLLYLAANAGARVGLATEVRDCLQVEWHDPAAPEAGWEYLYLSQRDYERLCREAPPGAPPPVNAEPLAMPDGSTRYIVSDVIGSEDGLGVECLSGSAAIASAFCRAWREGYTATLVSGRTVGIGAYLARLGRRCVQRADQPIVLTGYAALNKLLGRQVYTSHMQLGGPRVMGVNGVSHHVVADDLEGVATLLRLLAFAPPQLGAPHPALPSGDPVGRRIGYAPGPGEKLDPRAAIAGRDAPPAAAATPNPASSASWQSGLFDRGSWLESQAGWARTVVAGRARLGGIPVGVIAVESATVMRTQPADPGMPDSCEAVVPQAGQVWFPDSADKTAAAMEEFGAEGLPLFILANWRGFSGGMRDLFDGVLQAGSLIVERLRTYKQPVFVYIPAGAELRGGAWVVIDSQINAAAVELFADPTARGGVLEPEGVCEIKFRAPDLVRMMHRVDPIIAAARAAGAPASDPAIRSRERELMPTYSRIARTFADMHDTPVRMAAKGVLSAIVPWAAARPFFATRLRRRLLEQQLLTHAAATDPGLQPSAARELLREWHAAAAAAAASAASAAAHSGPLSPGAHAEMGGWGLAGLSSPTAPAASGGGAAAAADAEAAAAADVAFLAWAEGPTGRSHIAAELRAMRCRAAADMVGAVLGSAEGKEGLLEALQGAVARDGMLALQLRLLLQAASAPAGAAEHGGGGH